MNTTNKKNIYVLGGGTVFHLRPHFALSAPAYGKTARKIAGILSKKLNTDENYNVITGLTKMCGSVKDNEVCIGETNSDVTSYVESIISDPFSKIVFFSSAICDFEGNVGEINNNTFIRSTSGKNEKRLQSRTDTQMYVELKASDKIIKKIREYRKDIFLVGFKTTAGATEDEQYQAGLELLKSNSCNLVLANDVHTGLNMIICPEMAKYSVSTERDVVLNELVNISLMRSSNVFERTTILNGELVDFNSEQVPDVLRKVVKWAVENGAYKPFNNVTVGHFGFLDNNSTLWSSRRKQNYNLPGALDLVKVDFLQNKPIAYGAKPSAGVRSQNMVLKAYKPQNSCIIHFHCPILPNSKVKVMSQKPFECGSIQCGNNTISGLTYINDNISAVMLDKHGPNIVFSDNAKAEDVISFIKENFDLSRQTS